MATRRSNLEIILRAFLTAAVLFNALAPTLSASASTSTGQVGKQSSPVTILPAPLPIKYNPPNIHRPTRFDPAPDEPISPVPAKDKIEFILTSDSAVLDSNGNITLQVIIRNHSGQEVDNLTFTDPLEAGIDFVSASSSAITYDSKKKEITLSILKLDVEEELSFGYTLKVASSKRPDTTGRLWLHLARLDSDQGNIHLKANTPFGSGLSVGNDKSTIAVFNPGGDWNALGRYSIHMDKDAIAPDSIVMASPVSIPGNGPDLQFKLDVVKTGKLNKDNQGRLASQSISLGQVSNGAFKHPAFLEINLDGYIDLNHIPAGQEPYVATYDEANKIWVKVPILAVDRKSNKVTVQANHFSTWGAGLGNSLPQNGANVLLFDSHYTSLFTGAARYSIPIWTPPGRAGMAPDISLSYSSSTVDGVLGNVQAGWVGEGWNIDGVEIVRKITTSDTGYGYEDSYTLTINGAMYDLLVDPTNPKRYYSKQGAFLYVQRHNDVFDNNNTVGSGPNETNADSIKTDEWWEVVTTDGTRYFLGRHADSEQLALMYGYACTTGSPCTTPDGAYASSGYAGNLKNLVAMRWRVDRVLDTHNNYIDYSYTEKHPVSSLVPAFDRASYLDTIHYTGHVGDTTDPAGYYVKFVPTSRSGDGAPAANLWDNYDTEQLAEIQICYGTCSTANNIIRKYELGYTTASVPDSNGTLTLTSIDISGRTETGGSFDSAPTIHFTYENKDNRAVTGTGNRYPYPRLTKIENGYGGSLNYTYENDGRGTTSWYNWRVHSMDVDSGIETAAFKDYTYVTPIYTGSNNTGELIGYTDVTETTYDGTSKVSDTVHHFGTFGLDTGYELSTSWRDASGSVLQRTDSAYVTDNSLAPFQGWNYRYLYQVTNYVRSGNSLIQTTQTQYINDPGTGNLAEQDDYNGSTLLRKEYYEYWPNFNPSVYILDKPIRQVTVNPSNTIYSDTRYGYDDVIDFRTDSQRRLITQGELTLVQRLVPITGNLNRTADVAFGYDEYGNQTSVCAYTNYGMAGSVPTGNCELSSVSYDTGLHTYPIQSFNALNQETDIHYLLAVGLPDQVTDPNNWTTTTTYDGLGRTLSVTPPGLSQAGVNYTYQSPDGIGHYYVKMQIWDTRDGSNGTYRDVWGIYDGLGRMLQTQTRSDDGTGSSGPMLVADTYYDGRGLVSRQSLPYDKTGTYGDYAEGGAQFTEPVYDALGRAVQVTAPGGITSYTSYNGLTTTVTDPNGNKTARTTDGMGQLTTVQEYNGGNIYATTHYTYDLLGRLTGTTDAQSNATSLTYDWLGRKTSMDDPDMGSWSYQYDPLGNLTQQTDANGNIIQFRYDDLNRLKYKDDITNPNNAINLQTNTYGTTTDTQGSATNNIGFRIAMSDRSGSTSWSYSNYGRDVIETKTIGTVTKTSTTTSDWLGRVLTVEYPDNETLTYQYDALGRAKNFSSSQSGTLTELAYNNLSQLDSIYLGGTQANHVIAITNQYSAQTNRLTSRSAQSSSGSLMDFSYAYDQAGNITSITDSLLGETHNYQYDFLNRLTSADAVKNDNYPYRQTYEYDKVGNIQQVNNWESGDLIFKDDFEDVTLASWSSIVQGGSVSPDIWTMDTNSFKSASGQKSLLVEVNDTTDTYVQSSLAQAETDYSARFYFHPNRVTMASGDNIVLFSGNTSSGSVEKISLRYSSGVYQVRASLKDNTGNWNDGSWYTIGNQWNVLEADWQASSNGTLSFWVNGIFKQTIGDSSAIDNSGQQLVQVRLGAMEVPTGSSDASHHNQILFDAFESRRAAYVGPLPGQSADAGHTYSVAYPVSGSSGGVSSVPPQGVDTPTVTFTIVPSPVDTATVTPSPTDTATLTPGPSPTRTPTNTRTPTPTNTQATTLTPSSTPTPGLVAKWSFDETSGTAINDSVGSSYSDGTLYGAERVPGFGVNALRFTSTGQYVAIPNNTELHPEHGFTISMWVFPTEIQSGTTYVLLNKGGTNRDYRLYINSSGYLVFHIEDLDEAGVTPTVTPTPPANTADLLGPILPLNQWTHIAAVYDPTAGVTELYLNGTLVASRQVTGTISYGTGGVTISDATLPFNGMIDEVSLYSGILLETPIADLASLITTTPPWPTNTSTPSNTPTPSRTATLVIHTATPSRTPTASFTPSSTWTPTATLATGTPDPRWGNSSDDDLIVSSGTFNINTDSQQGARITAGCGDAVAYSVTALGSTSATLSSAPSTDCLATGDEVLLINLQGTTTSTDNAGMFEFLHIDSINGSQVIFTTSKINWYGEGWRSDSNIGTGTDQQRVMLMRVPNYHNVTISGTLTGEAFDGYKYGVVAFRFSGTLSGSGSINVNALGYRSAEGFVRYGNVYGGGENGTQSSGQHNNGGGGGYGTDGTDGNGLGGKAYGNPQLTLLFPGGGGGNGGYCATSCPNDESGSPGGRGGGILWMGGNNINFSGSISSNGTNGGAKGGASGAGGSIRVEGSTITFTNVSAIGGTSQVAAGVGRVAVYYKTSYSVTSNPTATILQIGQAATETPTPTPILNTITPTAWASGKDGDLTIASGVTFNINTQNSGNGSRTCTDGGDGVSYQVTALDGGSAQLATVPANGCLAMGDEVLLMNMQGKTYASANVGKYEFLEVADVVGNVVYFKTAKHNYYGSDSGSDVNIGSNGQRVLLQRVPSYNNLTVNGILTGNAWDGSKYGVLAFRVAGSFSGTGTIKADGLGYGDQEGYGGFAFSAVTFGGGESGPNGNGHSDGGGGGYGTNGVGGAWTSGGLAYGNPQLDLLFPGGGGGHGGYCGSCSPQSGSPGGKGGGIIWISAQTINFTGLLSSKGLNGGVNGGGAGAGGSIRVEGYDVTLGTASVSGGTSITAGGRGRIAVYYQYDFHSSFTPQYLQKQTTPDSLFQDDFETGDLSQWSSSVIDNGNLSVSDSLSYLETYGLQAVIDDNNALYVQDDTPDNETRYHARFYLNPAGMTMASGDILDLFDGYNNGTNVFTVQLQQVGGVYQVRAGILDNGTTWTYTSWYSLSNGSNAMEISYQALANDGAITLWLNGTSEQSLSLINDDTRTLTEVRLGAQGIETGTRGTLYLDAFESRRFSTIGTLPAPDLPLASPVSQPGWTPTTYTYDPNHPHAALGAGTNTYSYDVNGNMTCRFENGDVFIQSYNAENRLAGVAKLASGDCTTPGNYAGVWNFSYDGNGTRVAQLYTPYVNGQPQADVVTEYFMGGAYETKSDGTIRKYYSIAGQTVAVNAWNVTLGTWNLSYLLTDHLGSVVAITDASGTLTSQQRYLPFGQVRTNIPSPNLPSTDFGYTGQRGLGMGLMDYKARLYDPLLMRFISPDNIVPGIGSQAFNRYSYGLNNPLYYVDPSGHAYCDFINSQNKEDCKGGQWRISSSPDDLDFTGYSNWEKDILENLYHNGGPNARHGVNYILENSIHITVKSGWQSGFGSRGAWYEGNNLIVLNADLRNPDGSQVYSLDSMPDVWGQANIIHEARHIEQGPDMAWSKLGEMDAWQIGIDVAKNLGYYDKYGLTGRDLAVKKAETVDDFSKAIQDYDKSYWNALYGTLLGDSMCIGLCSLRDFPNICMSLFCSQRDSWWGN